MLNAFLALTLLAAPGVAPQDTTSIVITYQDLDLTTAAGTAELDRRLHRAVASVCPTPAYNQLARMHQAQNCRENALQAASAKRQQLIAIAQQHRATIVAGR